MEQNIVLKSYCLGSTKSIDNDFQLAVDIIC